MSPKAPPGAVRPGSGGIVALVPTVFSAIEDQPSDRVALRWAGETLRFGALRDRGLRTSAALAATHQVAPGDRIALLLEPGPAFVSALLAVWRLRGAALVLTPLHPPRERARLLADADARLVLTDGASAAAARACAEGRPVVDVEALARDTPAGVDDSAVRDAGAGSDPGAASTAPFPDDLALLVYTSGTTSRPKGVMLLHRHLAAQCSAIVTVWRLGPEDTLVHALPLHHVHGLVIALLSTLSAGGSTTLLPRFDAAAVVAAAADATVFMGVPTMYGRMVEHLEALSDADRRTAAATLARLRLCTSGSAALPVSIGRRWQGLVGRFPVERFGMTELGVALSNRVDAPAVPGSVGWPLPGLRVRILDDAGAPADEGELQVSGETVFAGYWRRPEADAEAFVTDRAGVRWFRTGDTVRVGADGCVGVLGRTSVDILKSAGYKLSAPAIEEAVRRHPLVQDVAVVGLPDETYGQVVAAAIVTRRGATLSAEALQAFLSDELADYQRPRVVRFVADLPRNALGKVVKPALAASLVRRPEEGGSGRREG